MAANAMMTVLRKVQRDVADQKDYMRNMHVIHQNINEKFKLMADKFDQQQATLERLEQEVRKNNTLLFGNESPIHFEEETASSYVPRDGKGLETSEKHMELNEANQLTTFPNEALNDMEWNAAGDNEMNDGSKKSEENNQKFNIMANDVKEIKELIAEFVRTERSVEETGPVRNQEALVTPSQLITEQINQLSNDFKNIMNEMKEFIKAAVETLKTSVGDTTTSVPNQDSASDFSTKENNQVSADLKQILSEVSNMKELIGQTVETNKSSVDETPAEVHHKETVQIPLRYSSTHQITKLNSVMKNYQEANILPNIEFISDTKAYDNHHIIKSLQMSINFPLKGKKTCSKVHCTCTQPESCFKIALGMKGFKRSEVIDMLVTNPGWRLYDVVKEGLRSTHEWLELSKMYNFNYDPFLGFWN